MVQQLIENFSRQLSNGLSVARNIRFVQPASQIRNVVIAGMGGSGIGGNLVDSLTFGEAKLPITVIKSYELPAFVDQHTLLVASSFSGNTEETLEVVQKALARQAVIACITSGGKLLEIANDRNLTLAQIPAEAPSPRAFIGYSAIQLLFLLHHYQVIGNAFASELEQTITLLNNQQQAIQQEARKLSAAIHSRLPIVYADAKLHPVIVRLQQQLNENSKQICHVNVFPEMNHNEIVGWVKPENLLSQATVVMVRTAYDHSRVQVRMNVCEPVFAEKGAKVYPVNAIGDSFLQQCFYLVHLFDWASFYLSEQNGVDAYEIRIIDYLKGELAKV